MADSEETQTQPRVVPALKEGYRITCVLYQGGGANLLEKLRLKGFMMSSLFYARGKMIGEPIISNRSFAFQMPKEVVVVLCLKDDYESLFQWIWEEQKIGEPAQGFLYSAFVSHMSEFCLPEGIS
ncbi:MAG: hypothetical protein H3C47_08575 [Candidatus Cloacimonetes bacterium]|nr:hypothetical protein [Candidatus Cloacimonadota bacterium]